MAKNTSILDSATGPVLECSEFYATYKLFNVNNHHLYSDKFAISVLDLSQIERATKEDKEYRLDYWAKLFLAQTWEEIKILAEKNEVIKEAAATMYAVSAEENIRLQCEARERYERDRRSLYSSGKKEGEEIGRKQGEKIGRKQGEERFSSLINLLIRDNRNDEIVKVSTNSEYRQKLYKEYNL